MDAYRGGLQNLAREVLPQTDQTVDERGPLVPGSLRTRKGGVRVSPNYPLAEEFRGAGATPPKLLESIASWKREVSRLQDYRYGAQELRVIACPGSDVLALTGNTRQLGPYHWYFALCTTYRW